MVFRISQERDKCIGCGTYAALCPENWEMKDDGKSSPIKTEVEKPGYNKDAEASYPAKCIHIIEK